MRRTHKFIGLALIAAISFTPLSLTGCKNSTGSKPVVLIDIAITKPPTKTKYNLGEELNMADMVVTATYSDGSTQTVTAC